MRKTALVSASANERRKCRSCLEESVLKEFATKIKFLRFITAFLVTCKVRLNLAKAQESDCDAEVYNIKLA